MTERVDGAAVDFSVIVPAYNAEAFLERAVGSALEQTGTRVEVLVVDDASSDGTLALARSLAAREARVRVFAMTRNGGPGAARNLGLDHARGDWVALLDADDAMAPTRLSHLAAVAAATRADMVADNLMVVPDEGGAQKPLFQVGGAKPALIPVEMYVRRNQLLSRGANLGYLKPVVRRALIERTGAHYRPELRIGEDYHFCLDLLAAGAVFAVTSEVLYFYTARAGSISHRLSRSDIAALIAAHAAFVSAQGPRLTPDLRAALDARAADLSTADQFQALVDSLKDGAFAQAGALLSHHPALLPLLGHSAFQGLARRVRAAAGG